MAKKLELTLFDKEGEPTTYSQNHVSGQKLLDYWALLEELEKTIDKISPAEIFAKRVEFVAGLFGNKKVTAKAIIEGVDSWDLVDTVDRLIEQAIGADRDNDPKGLQSVQEMQEISS